MESLSEALASRCLRQRRPSSEVFKSGQHWPVPLHQSNCIDETLESYLEGSK